MCLCACWGEEKGVWAPVAVFGPQIREYLRLGTSAFNLGYLEVMLSLVPLSVFGSSCYTWKAQITPLHRQIFRERGAYLVPKCA